MAVPPTAAFSFPAGVVIPLAQIVVVDAAQGDANLVDFCRLPPLSSSASEDDKIQWGNEAWRRTLIDTGPPSAGTVKSLQLLAGTQALPRLNQGGSTVVPRLHHLQITHPDADHIGNASAFLDAMVSLATTGAADGKRYIDRLRGCKIMYCQIPEMYKAPTVVMGQAKWSDDARLGEINEVTFSPQMDQAWVEQMNFAGICPVASVCPMEDKDTKVNENDFTNDRFKWVQGQGGPNTWGIVYDQTVPASQAKRTVMLRVQVRLEFEGDRKVKANRNDKGIITMSELARETVENRDRPTIVLEPETQAQLEAFPEFRLTWTSRPKPNPPGPGGGLMSNMVINRRVFQAPTMPSVGSIPQLLTFAEKIDDLKGMTFLDQAKKPSKVNLNLSVQPPEAGMLFKATWPVSNTYGYIRIQGPSQLLYGNMMREILVTLYRYYGKSPQNQADGTPTVNSDTINRSSIVTLFERPESDPNKIDASFCMLFTGDAYDKACDIRDTLMTWKRGLPEAGKFPTIRFDVMKVPHHGSDVSASSGFYSFIRADTYIISGRHNDPNGNPKLSTLTAIVRGFKGKTTKAGGPFRIFFSNSSANANYKSVPTKENPDPVAWRSPVLALRNDPELKPGKVDPDTKAKPLYYYRMYMLKWNDWYNPNYAPFGQIAFGKDKLGNLITSWNTDQWTNISGTGDDG